MASCPDKDDGVAGQPGASPPAQVPILPAASSSQHPTLSFSLPPSPLQQHYEREPQPHMDLGFPELNSNRAIDASLFDIIRYISVQPPQAAPAAPFAQPAFLPPPEMQPPIMQTQHFSQQSPAMGPMHGNEYNGYLGAASVHDAAHYAVLPDETPLPPAGPAVGRRRGRPPGSTAKSKSKPKLAKRPKNAVAAEQPAATLGEEWPTSEQPADTASASIATDACEREEHGKEAVDAGSDGVEQEVVEYGKTNIPGIRFTPSDAEIISYLRRKYLGRRMPVDFIKDFDVFEHHPSVIKEELGKSTNGSWYVFSPRNRKYDNGYRPARSVGVVGYWKSNNKEASVKYKNIEIGKVNSLTFMLGRQPKGAKTTWKMKEYRIAEYQLRPDPTKKLLDPHVICRLFNTEDQDDVPVQDQTDDESEEHVDMANGSGGEDTVDGNQPPNDPEDELDIDEYLALDDLEHGDPADQ